MVDGPFVESAPAAASGQTERTIGSTIGETEIDWLLDHVDRTHRTLPDGAFDRLTRQARELLHLEWLVLEPDRLDLDHAGRRPAISPNTVLTIPDDVAWLRHLLDQLWQEQYPAHADRRRAIVRAVRAEAEALRRDLRDTEGRIGDVVEAILDRQTARMLSRADDRADDPDVDRTIGQLTDKLRLTVRVAALTEAPTWPATLADLTDSQGRDPEVVDAWSACGYHPADIPQLATIPEPEDPVPVPELWGRDPLRHLSLMLDPSGPVDARPLPDALRLALRTPHEASAIDRAVALEVRRATFPGGLRDDALRARWFLAVLFAESRWSASKLRGEVARHAEPDPVAALRRLIRADPAPHTIDRARSAALLQTGVPVREPVDGDGWQRPVAHIAFDGARSSRFAVPADVAVVLAPIDTCGIRLRGYLHDGSWNRAGRSGEVGMEQLCELSIARYRHKIYQRLLKDDQLDTGTLRHTTPEQWHAVTTKQMRRAARTTLSRYRCGRPLIEDRPAADDSADDPSLSDGLDPDALELLGAGPRTAAILADLTRRWLAQHGRLTVAMDRRIADLREFRDWLDREGVGTGPAGPVLRGIDLPLRQVLHRFVVARDDRPSSAGRPEAGPPRSDQAARRARQRASQGLLAAVTTMLADLGRPLDAQAGQ